MPNAEFRTLDAERMDLDDGSIDGVLCRWGYMLMADPRLALAETRRVLGDGGRVALSVWGDPEQNPWASIPSRVLLEQHGCRSARSVRTRDLRDGERGAHPRAARGARGSSHSRIENVEMAWRFDSLAAYWHYVTDLPGAVAMIVRALPEEDQAPSATRSSGASSRTPTAAATGFPGCA